MLTLLNDHSFQPGRSIKAINCASATLRLMQSSHKKSCQHCRKAKVRCSLTTPECTRCQKRKRQCLYDQRPREGWIPESGNANMFNSWLPETIIGQFGAPKADALDIVNGSPDIGLPATLNIPGTIDHSESLLADWVQSSFPIGPQVLQDDSRFQAPLPAETAINGLRDDVCWFESIPITAEDSFDSSLRMPSWPSLNQLPTDLPNILNRKQQTRVS